MESEGKIDKFEDFTKTESDEIKKPNQLNGGQMNHRTDKENENPNTENKENNIRRHDEPSELSFEICTRTKIILLLFVESMSSSIFIIACS